MWYPNTGKTEEKAVIPTLGPTLGWAKEQAYNQYWPMIKTRIFAVRAVALGDAASPSLWQPCVDAPLQKIHVVSYAYH